MKEAKFFTKKTPAKFWKRVVAYVLDLSLINLVAIYPFRDSLEQYSNYSLLLSSTADGTVATITFIVILLSLFYFIFMEYKTGQTFGKMLMKITTLSVKGDLTLRQAVIRNLTKPFPIVLSIDTLYMFFKRTHQRLLERFSQTEVVEQAWTLA